MRVREEVRPHIHESPKVMAIPLVILSFFSVVAGYVGVPALLGGGAKILEFLNPAVAQIEAEAHGSVGQEVAVMTASVIVALLGIFVAYRMYVKDPTLPERMSERAQGVYKALSGKYYVDELYDFIVVNPIKRTALIFWSVFDTLGIDGAVNGIASIFQRGSWRVRWVQSGLIQNYALGLFLGVVVILGYLVFRR